MDSNFSPNEPFKNLTTPRPIIFPFTTDEGMEELWAGVLKPALLRHSGILFANNIKRYFMVHVWQNGDRTRGRIGYLSLEDGVWTMGYEKNFGLEEIKDDRFMDELKKCLLNWYLKGGEYGDEDENGKPGPTI